MAIAYFRFTREAKARAAGGKRVQKQAPDNGTWWLRYRNSAGREVRERCSARLEEEALRLLREKTTRAERVRAGLDASDLHIIPCDEMFDAYLAAHAHLRSQGPMRSQVKRWFKPHFKRRPSVEVTPAHCEALLAKSRNAGQSPATVRQLHIRGRIIWKWAQHSLRAVRENPWASVKRPGVRRKKVIYLDRDTVTALLEAAGPWRLLILTALLSGLRRGELRRLKWTDIRWKRGPFGVIHLADPKSQEEEQEVPLHPFLADELKAAQKASTVEHVFPAPRKGGERHESWHVARLLRNIAKRAGIPLPKGMTFHGLRKTFVTHLLVDTGGDIFSAQKLARHSTPQVTMSYAGTELGRLSQKVALLSLVSARHTVGTRQSRPSDTARHPKKKAK